MKTTTKERYENIKKALDNGMSCLAATHKFNASMSTISRVKAAKSYEDFVQNGRTNAKKIISIKPVAKKSNKVETPKDTIKSKAKVVSKKSPWDKVKSFFGI